jgi:hypothetical protein
VEINEIISLPVVERIGRSKYITEDNMKAFDEIEHEIKRAFTELIG